MAVHVGEMITEATVEPETRQAPADAASRPTEATPGREALTRLARDQTRTAAEGYDD